MKYNISTTVKGKFDNVVENVIGLLKAEGFGVLTEVDIKSTLKAKLNVDFRNYKVLGACNPAFAYQMLLKEADAGLIMPCNVAVQESNDGVITVSVINPKISVQAMNNTDLNQFADEIALKLQRVINDLN